jgi:hypothetical protein
MVVSSSTGKRSAAACVAVTLATTVVAAERVAVIVVCAVIVVYPSNVLVTSAVSVGAGLADPLSLGGCRQRHRSALLSMPAAALDGS